MRRTAGTTRTAILAAARDLVAGSGPALPTVGQVAARAGVSRLSVYHHFGSHGGLMAALAASARQARPAEPAGADARDQLRERIRAACEQWALDPGLYRRLPAATAIEVAPDHELAQLLAAEDRLRPGCSLKEAEDVVAVVTSFAAFDRLHQGGRRSVAAVAEILNRMAGAILAASI